MRCRAATPPGAGRTLAPMTDALPPSPPATIQLLRAGRHIASDGRGRDYPAAELADMCAVYDPALYQAPIVVGHPTDDAPAYGWLAALRYDPVAQAVEGVPAEIDPDFAAAHRAGRLPIPSAQRRPASVVARKPKPAPLPRSQPADLRRPRADHYARRTLCRTSADAAARAIVWRDAATRRCADLPAHWLDERDLSDAWVRHAARRA